MKILIPPSEGKTEGGNQPSLNSLPKEVRDRWNSIPEDNLSKFYGLKEKALEKAISANKEIKSSKTLPAIERYKGVVYKGIDYSTLDFSSKEFFNKNFLIISGLFGPVAPTTLLPDYKYKIQSNAKFEIDDFCLDLLPQAHSKAINCPERLRIDFVIQKGDKRMPAGHNGKLIKGRFVRWLCENKVTDIKKIKNFSEDGFTFDGENFIKRLS